MITGHKPGNRKLVVNILRGSPYTVTGFSAIRFDTTLYNIAIVVPVSRFALDVEERKIEVDAPFGFDGYPKVAQLAIVFVRFGEARRSYDATL